MPVGIDKKVVALDPGRTTGHATGLISEGLLEAHSGQDQWNHLQLYDQLRLAKPDIIVCEDFEYRNRARAGLDLYSRELIGIVNLYVQETRRDSNKANAVSCTLTIQKAAQGKGFYSDGMLKKDKLHRPGKPHANDAMRHLLHWFTFGAGYQYNTRGYEPLSEWSRFV